MLNLEQIGKKISERRKELNMTQNVLAETLFVTHQAVSKWENGKSLPTIDLLYELTNVLQISIDYLLDDTEINEDDYQTQLKQYPRESVINKVLYKENVNQEIDKLYYLLNDKERKTILDLLVSNKTSINLKSIWHLLSPKERQYILSVIWSGKYDYDLNLLFHQLTQAEQIITVKHYIDGRYLYKIPYNKGVIL
jgi:transcriptional regulator with XRE-family HTH domain